MIEPFVVTLVCVVSFGFLLAVVGVIVGLRYLGYRETMALAEKGLAPPPRASDGKSALRWGILIAAIGVALVLGLWPLGATPFMQYPFGFGPWMLFGLLPLFFGLGLILIYLFTREGKPQ